MMYQKALELQNVSASFDAEKFVKDQIQSAANRMGIVPAEFLRNEVKNLKENFDKIEGIKQINETFQNKIDADFCYEKFYIITCGSPFLGCKWNRKNDSRNMAMMEKTYTEFASREKIKVSEWEYCALLSLIDYVVNNYPVSSYRSNIGEKRLLPYFNLHKAYKNGNRIISLKDSEYFSTIIQYSLSSIQYQAGRMLHQYEVTNESGELLPAKSKIYLIEKFVEVEQWKQDNFPNNRY